MPSSDTRQSQTRTESDSDASTLHNPSESDHLGSTAIGSPTHLPTDLIVQPSRSNLNPMSKAAISRRASSPCVKLDPSDVAAGRNPAYPHPSATESTDQRGTDVNRTHDGEPRKSFGLGRRPTFASFDLSRRQRSSSIDIARFQSESPSEGNTNQIGWFNLRTGVRSGPDLSQQDIPPVPPIPDFFSGKSTPKKAANKIPSQASSDNESHQHHQNLLQTRTFRKAASMDVNRSSFHLNSNSSSFALETTTASAFKPRSSFQSDIRSNLSSELSTNNNSPTQNQPERPPSTPMRSVPVDTSPRPKFGIGRKGSFRNLGSKPALSSTTTISSFFENQKPRSSTDKSVQEMNNSDRAAAAGGGKSWLNVIGQRRPTTKVSKDSDGALSNREQESAAARRLNTNEKVEWMGVVRRKTTLLFKKRESE
ncbi:hypothetical protein BJ741DRAFT_592680 [Chytriomyces cf. hyalinus JEL632]|nr:hypothetical protein BJ741DRAFT_592680 [Chytriomyces cf. hyalinus JEL632]